MNEIWIATNNKNNNKKTIIAVSNKGRIIRKNGTVEDSTLRQEFWYNKQRMFIYRFIALKFIPKTEDDKIKNRIYVDHITHNPKDIAINDIRNLRWCTTKENANFDESIKNRSIAKKGKPSPRKGCILSEETKHKQSLAKLGKSPWNKGQTGYKVKNYNYTEESMKKRSDAMKGKFKGLHWHIENGKRVWER